MFLSSSKIDAAAKNGARVAVSLVAIVCATPALAGQPDAKTSIRPIVALEMAAGDAQSFMAFLSAADARISEGRDYFQHAFTASAPPAAKPESGAAAKPVETSIIVADADPYFERWQKDADERLKEENSRNTPLQNPLQMANPDKAVVVCEAGCRTTKDEIVYIAAVVPAVLPAGSLEPSSSAGATAAPLDEGSLPCIAGCYERSEPRSHTTPRRTAEATGRDASTIVTGGIGAVNAATANLPASPALPQIEGRKAARFGKIDIARLTLGHMHAVRNQAQKAARMQVAYNGAIVEHRPVTQPATLRHALIKPVVGRKVQALHAWRTSVSRPKATLTTPQTPRRVSVQRAVERAIHSAPRTKYKFRFVSR